MAVEKSGVPLAAPSLVKGSQLEAVRQREGCMGYDGVSQVAVCCQADGMVTQVFRDEVALGDSLTTGQYLTGIVAADERSNVLSLLRRIVKHGAVVDHEIEIPSQSGRLRLFFYGCTTNVGIVIIGSSKLLTTTQLCDEFIEVTNQNENAIRNTSLESMRKWRETKTKALGHVDELAHLNDELLLMQRKLIEKSVGLEREKIERFQELGMAVHGLRNPASSILAAAEYLIGDSADALGEDQMTLLRGIARSSLFMLCMIENVLDISKFECGKLTANSIPTDLVALINEVLTLNQAQAERKDVHLETHFPSPTLLIDLDPNKITQVVDNLVGNAIKFSSAGGKVDICISANEDFVSVSIRDEGQGIPAEHIETIFNPFQRGMTNNGLQKAGTGLGLAISKRMVEFHAGTINVQSQLGKGSVFTINLPTKIGVKKDLSCSHAGAPARKYAKPVRLRA